MRVESNRNGNTKWIVRVAAVGVAGLGASSAEAQIYWDGSGPDNRWLTTQNWESSLGGDVQPGFADTAILNNGGTILIDADGPAAGAFQIGRAADTTISPFNLGLGGTVNFNSGSLLTGANIPSVDVGVDVLAEGGVAVWNQNGGTLTTGELFRIGVALGSSGTVNMNGGLIDVSTGDNAGLDFFLVGDNGTGVLNMSAGEIRSRGLFGIALQNTANGTVNLSGGTINASGPFEIASRGNPSLGTGSVGLLKMTGGTVNVAGTLITSFDKFSSGTIDQSGGSIVAREILIGRDGDGTLILSGNATMDSNSSMVISTFANGTPSNSSATVSGTAVLTVGGMLVGEQSNGTLNLNGGTVHILGVTRNGATFPGGPTFGNLLVGRDGGGPIRTGNGVVNQTAGTMTVDTNIFLGDFDDSSGTYNISGGTLNVTGNLNVGAALASNAPPDATRTGTQGQALGAVGKVRVQGGAASINIGGKLLANPGDKTRTGTPNAATLAFEVGNGGGLSRINVAGPADLDGAVIDLGFMATTKFVAEYNQAFDLVNAASFGATGTGTTQNTGTGTGYTLAAGDATDWSLRIIAGGNGSILQAVNLVVPGDTDADKDVDFQDLVALAQNYNGTSTTRAKGDFDRDAKTNFDDLVILAQHYNSNFNSVVFDGGSSDFAADLLLAQSLVPEPTSALALGAAASGLLLRRRRHDRRA